MKHVETLGIMLAALSWMGCGSNTAGSGAPATGTAGAGQTAPAGAAGMSSQGTSGPQAQAQAGRAGMSAPASAGRPSAATSGAAAPSSSMAGASGASGAAGVAAVSGSGATGGTSAAGAAGSGPAMGSLTPVTDVSKMGPYAVTVDQKGGANSWVFRPTDLGKDGVIHPIFVFGCGATSTPSQYMDHWTMVASHGFVVVSPNNSMVDAPAMKASLDWILAQNDAMGSPYYKKLDVKHVAMGGHSLGSIATFDQEAMETRLTTTIHIAGGSFDMMGSSKVKTPTAYICGQMDLDLASPNCKNDWDAVKDQPTYFVQMAGVNHVDAARAALPAIVAWLRWYLAGEDRKSMFVGAGCDFCKDMWANAMSKNF
jgi:hypothetical protein